MLWTAAAFGAPCQPGHGECRPSATSPIEENKRAVDEGLQGLALYQKGNWSGAYRRFSVADRIAHSPVFVLYMARSRRNAGRLVDARRLFLRVVKEPLPANAPAPWTRAQADAQSELAALEPRIPKIELRVVGPGSGSASAWLDGQPITQSLAQPLLVDPGSHTLRVDSSPAQHVDLHEGETRRLEFRLHRTRPISAPHRTITTPAWIAFAVGAAGVATGAVTGTIAWHEANDVKQRCDGTHCLKSDAAEGARASSFATASDVAFIVGAVGAASGLALVLFSGGGQRETALVVGPDQLRLRSRF